MAAKQFITEEQVRSIYEDLREYERHNDRDCRNHYTFVDPEASKDWSVDLLKEKCRKVNSEILKRRLKKNDEARQLVGKISAGFDSEEEKEHFHDLSQKYARDTVPEGQDPPVPVPRPRFANLRRFGGIAAAVLLGIWGLRTCLPEDRTSPPLVADDHSCAQESMTPVQAGSSAAGRLERPNDEDCFAFDVPTMSTIVLETSGGTDTVGVLRGNGVEAEDDDGGSGHNFRISRRVSPGAYSLLVAGYEGTTTGDYTLTIQVTPERAERQRDPVVPDSPTATQTASTSGRPAIPDRATPTRSASTSGRPAIPDRATPTRPGSGKAETLLAEAEGGSAGAQLQLGLLYAAGDGVTRSYPEALRWLQRAASAGEPDGAMHLALMYAAGEGVPQDQSQAFHWFTEYLRGNRVAIGEDDPSEAFDALTAQLAGTYRDLHFQYLRRFDVRSFVPGNRDLRWRSSIPREDYRRRSADVLDTFRKEAQSIRSQFAFNMPPALRNALVVGAAIQRDRSPAIRQNVAAALLIGAQRAFQGRARTANARYQAAVQEAERRADAVAALFAEPPSDHAGALKMNVRQRDAVVFVDDERYGTVDDMNDGEGRLIRIGRRRIRVELAGHETHEETLVIGAGERYEVSGSLRRR